MVETGTAIERQRDQGIQPVASDVVKTDTVPVEVLEPERVALQRASYAQRMKIIGRVLSLLTSLGDLALRVLENRAVSSTTEDSPAARLSAPPSSVSQLPRGAARQGSRDQRGQGRGRHRRRQRGST